VIGQPGPGSIGGTRHGQQVIQRHVQLHLRGLARAVRQTPRRQQQPHGLFEGVVAALPGRAVILRARLLA
jgi:hypothetical protein